MNGPLGYAAGQFTALRFIGPRLYAVRALDFRSVASAHRNHLGPVEHVVHEYLGHHLEGDGRVSQVP